MNSLAHRNISMDIMHEIFKTAKQAIVEYNLEQNRCKRKWPMAGKYQPLGSLCTGKKREHLCNFPK